MRDEHTVICSPAVFELIAPDAPPVPVTVELTYNSRDPYAVQASFRTGSTTAVEWVFARDLLGVAEGFGAESFDLVHAEAGRLQLADRGQGTAHQPAAQGRHHPRVPGR